MDTIIAHINEKYNEPDGQIKNEPHKLQSHNDTNQFASKELSLFFNFTAPKEEKQDSSSTLVHESDSQTEEEKAVEEVVSHTESLPMTDNDTIDFYNNSKEGTVKEVTVATDSASVVEKIDSTGQPASEGTQHIAQQEVKFKRQADPTDSKQSAKSLRKVVRRINRENHIAHDKGGCQPPNTHANQ